MKNFILVAGATGDLGARIIKSLIGKGAEVHALVRSGSDEKKIDKIAALGAQIIEADLTDATALTNACMGATCVVSALAGLRDVIVDTQVLLLKAAVKAGVPRFIPSDFSSDFTKLQEGENRNFDLRREFHTHLDKADIKGTSILIGAFADILSYNTPFYNLKEQSVAYWGEDPNWKVDFTTKDNAAEFTASAALDPDTPRILRIHSFSVSPVELTAFAKAFNKGEFRLMPMGSLADFAAYNKRERAAHPEGEHELYAKWQQSQYMHSMFSVQNTPLDNDRYPNITWTTATEVVSQI
ncbi:NmrA family NAD(P)-binding protein [[Flexibacter] sp. ATCC 35208]|uniref:NmrA family NAD(P)-binding protein n=1 Tax=[Flexibacter] sp. ATCC 35208 TaxID=1936242 RepID=UPI0009D578DB|nr:NmrA family NAD(P)-binding protein [[Flexibacter] sp. ATCC 35208]OMP75881.1 NmrA family protein [[Flexibacter] sp. ATCC 35208]